ncbi:MAG: AbrB/MazE/SpoVT family DNA-binding domain-containing protein [Candidatus Marinimicrobia bacterium]|nr:AbrB/MazE/SpoVT family DNA-binding domain-containing protein [Candidatus Neomarinimicrobiota bacterium]MCF7840465.1 AbrB/MazE/SpoVT family DNA-binding domain-containing protein [Candidatus Neomarinimicrobiota bacterium]MCF7903258.1 AbrB/MazE/SpoVT family DNA-binding domain-containing protein [Candidatus Neomarinimicrobiota bacterium]
MNTVTISPKCQVVIPKAIPREMELKPGQKLRVIQLEDRIEFMLVKNLKEMRGFLKGMDTTIQRDRH